MPEMISHTQIILLCARTLRLYDQRLVEHGERVAYLTARIREELEPDSGLENKTLMILSLFHDVGAYKTEEIDRMVEFETGNVAAHSIYGYLFLKYFTPIGPAAEAVLYHHMEHEKLVQANIKLARYAEIIHLADRTDIAVTGGSSGPGLTELLRRAGSFDPELIDALERVMAREDVCGALRSGAASAWVTGAAQTLDATPEEAIQYLKMLVYSIDFKSEFTVVHSVNTTVISLYLAWRLGLSREELERIYYAALVHDVGKMAIPESILEFPGKLNEEQMAVMRRHVEHTETIIASVLPPDITAIAVRHHEKLDGSGYPRGLNGAALSTSDRIVAVADIVSALSGRRSYKDAFDRARIEGILQDMARRGQLDAGIVELVTLHYDEMAAIMQAKTAPVLELYQAIQREYAVLLSRAD